MKLADVTEEMFKAANGVVEVKAQIFDTVCAGPMARCSAAGEDGLGLPVAGPDNVIFEKRDRQEGNGTGVVNGVDVKSEVRKILFVNGIVFCLEMKELKRNIIKGRFVYRI